MLIAKWTLNVGLVAQSLVSSVVLANNYVFFPLCISEKKGEKENNKHKNKDICKQLIHSFYLDE